MSAEVVGRAGFEAEAANIAAALEVRPRAVASAAAQRIATGVRARVRAALRTRLRAAVRVVEEPGARQFVVGFDDDALFNSGLFPMVPVWHEFGTQYKTANPAVGDAFAEERPRYLAEMRQAVTDILEGAKS